MIFICTTMLCMSNGYKLYHFLYYYIWQIIKYIYFKKTICTTMLCMSHGYKLYHFLYYYTWQIIKNIYQKNYIHNYVMHLS